MTQTSKQTLISNFSATISKYEQKNLAELLETHNITPSQFKNIVINEVKKSEKMQQAFLNNPASLFASILLCAELGLNPSADVGKEIMEIVEMSKYPNALYGSNKDPQGWMYKKTVIKQLSKTLPKDYYGKRGISVDDKVEGGGYLKLDDDNNIMFVDGKKIIPKRSKSVYANLDIDVQPLNVSEIEVIEPQEIVVKDNKSKKDSLTLDLKTDTSVS